MAVKVITEKAWITKEGYLAEIRIDIIGNRLGYVSVPKKHKAFGLQYYTDSLLYNIEVHGGLTYSARTLTNNKTWALGFDVAHYCDIPDYDKAESIFGPSIQRDISKSCQLVSKGTKLRTLKFMTKECNKLSKQLSKLDKG